jgi:hypothetical protein
MSYRMHGTEYFIKWCVLLRQRVDCVFEQQVATLFHKRQIFKKENTERKMCFDFLYKLCLKHFSFYQELSNIWSHLYTGLHAKYPLLTADINDTWIFSIRFSKNTQMLSFMKIRPEGDDLLRADRPTDGHDEANSRFSQFCERLKTIPCPVCIICRAARP